MNPVTLIAILVLLSALLSFALFLRGVLDHLGGPVVVLFGSWATIGSVLFLGLLAFGVIPR